MLINPLWEAIEGVKFKARYYKPTVILTYISPVQKI